MKNIMTKIIPLILAMVVVTGLGQSVFAETVKGTVTYDGSSVDLAYSTSDINARLASLTPGDDVELEFALANNSDNDTDWYVEDNVVRTFEDSSKASNGAYTYKLTYTDSSGTETDIYSSDVGGSTTGSAPVGLHQASSGSEKYFYLDSISPGDEGTFKLSIAIDGETLRNDYQSTIADLEVNFAVEETAEDGTTTSTKSNKPGTGDETRLAVYTAAFVFAALLLIIVAAMAFRGRKRGDSNE